jgi:site-specific DNA-methyltransferase (adenine-specific)
VDYENRVFEGLNLTILRQLPDEVYDAGVFDPPYGLGKHEPTPEEILQYLQGADLDTGGDFKGSDWEIPSVLVWKEIYRVMKPGAYVAFFGGTRTMDLISIGARMAGFISRDSLPDNYAGLQWLQSQGMPKSSNVSKFIDKKFGNPVPKKGYKPTAPEAKEWLGHGTALKPSWEPIMLFRKPFKGSLTDNVLTRGTGVLNIDGCRVKHASKEDFEEHKAQVEVVQNKGGVRGNSWKNSSDLSGANDVKTEGRWPPNVLFNHSAGCKRTGVVEVAPHPQGPDRFQNTSGGEFSAAYGNQEASSDPEYLGVWECEKGCPVAALDEQSGDRPATLTGRADPSQSHEHPGTDMSSESGFLGGEREHLSRVYADSGGASKYFPQFEGQEIPKVPFFYHPKVSKKEATLSGRLVNEHISKKPVALMRWIIRLVCPKGGLILDPYCGSGSTLHAAILEGMMYTGMEKDPVYVKVSRDRVRIVTEDLSEDGFDLLEALSAAIEEEDD